jgi:hypothetical protein
MDGAVTLAGAQGRRSNFGKWGNSADAPNDSDDPGDKVVPPSHPGRGMKAWVTEIKETPRASNSSTECSSNQGLADRFFRGEGAQGVQA